MRIIIDSDGVLFNPHSEMLRRYKDEYGIEVKMENIVDWDLRKLEAPGTNMRKYFNQPGFFRNLPVIPEAKKYLKKLQDDGHDVVIATASPPNGFCDKAERIMEAFPFIPFKNIIMVTRKEVLQGDILIDDGPHNILDTRCKYPIVFDARYNRHLTDYVRGRGWMRTYEIVCQLDAGITYEEILDRQMREAKSEKGPIIILMGPSGSGKDYIQTRLINRGHINIVSATTRKPREHQNEVPGIHYHYMDELPIDICAEHVEYNGNYYGILKEELKPNRVAVAEPEGSRQIKESGIPVVIIFVEASKKTRRHRMLSRGDKQEEVNGRLSVDKKHFKGAKGLADYIFNNEPELTEKRLDELVEVANKIYRSKLEKKTA